MKALTARQIIKILETNGFAIARQRGSHIIYRQIESGRIVPVPLHGGNRPLPIGTCLSIVKQSGLSQSDFRK